MAIADWQSLAIPAPFPIRYKAARVVELRRGYLSRVTFQLLHRGLVAAGCPEAHPEIGQHVIPRYITATFSVDLRQVELGGSIVLLGRSAIPLHRFHAVLRSGARLCIGSNGFAVDPAEVELGIGIPLISRLAEPLQRHCMILFGADAILDRKSTRLNSSHGSISYA